MVATGDHIDLLVLENVKGVFAFRFTGIVKTVALDTVSRVDQQ